jgi:hypothetical protein
MKIVFTLHANERIIKRKISKQDVLFAIKNPDNMKRKRSKYFFRKRTQNGVIEVVCQRKENNLKIITLYWL